MYIMRAFDKVKIIHIHVLELRWTLYVHCKHWQIINAHIRTSEPRS